MANLPFDKVTVTALAARCGISSNTFYCHFRDIYDLLDSWLDKYMDNFMKQTETMDNWTEKLKVVLHNMQDNPKLVYHIFDSISRDGWSITCSFPWRTSSMSTSKPARPG